MFFTLIIFILIFSFLILSHEFGHFLAAKIKGVKVEEFGIGYPPRIFGKKIGQTIYSLNYIPFGGFVRVYGEDLEGESLKDPKSFANKPPGAKAAILLAGAGVNLLVAVILFYFLLATSGFETFQIKPFDYEFPFGEQRNYAVISYVAKGSPADLAEIKPYDLVISGDNQEMQNSEQLIAFINEHKGREITLSLKNIQTGKEKSVKTAPRLDPPEGEGALGIGVAEVSQLSYHGIFEKTFSGFLQTANMGHFSLSAMGYLIRTSISQRDIRPISDSVAGPVGILALTKLSMAGGVWQVFNLIAVISLALAIVNLLPIPAADGGRLVFVIYEWIFKKRVSTKLERGVNTVGFFILIILLALVTFKDIIQFKDILF